ncbi:MAG: DUF2784 family protein [Nitrospinota bacterium]|nr:DUF2784 family protein [Nitrospinota bacterium]MDH5790255.1 DUF2784 family protein [Nitrospinota bacterium]
MRARWVFMDYMLHMVHLSIMFICVVGWMFEPFHVLHLAVVILVALSWFGLGKFFGYGYCALTDAQWRIKRKLGQEPYTDSYVKYILDKVTGRDIDQKITDHLTLYTYVGAVVLSLAVNFIL